MAGFNNKGNTNSGTGLTPAELLLIQTLEAGVLNLTETTAPSATSGVGKIYVKSSDSKPYFKDDSGNEYSVLGNNTYVTVGRADADYICDGTADQTEINAAFEYARLNEKTVYVKAGSYSITASILAISSGVFDVRASIVAASAMDAMLYIGRTANSSNNTSFFGGSFDCNNLANIGVWMRRFSNSKLINMSVLNALVAYFSIGDDGDLPTTSFEADLDHIHGYRNSGSVPSGSVGLLVNTSATDGYYSNSIFNGMETGVKTMTGINFFNKIHVWGSPTVGSMSVGFDDYGNRNYWHQCEADSFGTYGFHLREFYTKISQCYMIKDPNTADSTGTGILFDQNDPQAAVLNSVVRGSAVGNRLLYDISAPVTANITRTGTTYEYAVNLIDNIVTNTSLGYQAINDTNNGPYGNTAIGWRSMSNTDAAGINNTAVGTESLLNNASGVNNTSVGTQTLRSNSSGSYNHAFGRSALYSNTTGAYNIAIGDLAGESYVDKISADPGAGTNYNSTVDTDMIFIGNGATRDVSIPTATPLSNSIVIGYNTTVDESDKIVIGNSSHKKTCLNGNVGINTNLPTKKIHAVQKTTDIGTVSNSAGGTTVTGVGTQFTNTFRIGDSITIGSDTVIISAIASDTSMTTSAITNAHSGATYTLVGGDRFNLYGGGLATSRAGTTSSKVITYGGKIKDFFTDVGNVTTGEDDLYSYTTEANLLGVNGDTIEADFGGVFVSSATATREIKLFFGGTAIFDTGALTLSLSSAWNIYVTIIRVSATVIRYTISFTTEGAALAAYTACGELTGLTLSNTNVLKITGEAAGVGAATNDIVAKLGTVYWYPAAI